MKLWKNKKMNKNVVQTSNCEELVCCIVDI